MDGKKMNIVFVCRICKKNFDKQITYTQHMKYSHKMNDIGKKIQFTCVQCNTVYSRKCSLQRHIDFVHFMKKDEVKYLCEHCNFKTSYRANLSRHYANVHNNSEETQENSSDSNFGCSKCSAKYKYKKHLRHHERNVHKVGEISVPIKKRKCPLCPYVSYGSKMDDILSHFFNVHGIEVIKSTHHFESIKSFNVWKNNIEKKTTSSFVKTASRTNITYFSCHRSGFFKPKGLNKRSLKLSGSCKIEGYCPALIIMKVKEDTEVCVEYISTHVGHENELKYIRLTNDEKKNIALQLKNNKSHSEILEAIKSSAPHNQLQRIHLTKRKDLHNIEKCFNLRDKSTKDPFDHLSITPLIDVMRASGQITVLDYKPQGVEQQDDTQLKREDFFLVLMTEGQKDFLLKNMNIICVNGTEELHTYGFQLYTLLAIDETREGFPIAFLLTNRKDEAIMATFFNSIKQAVGEVRLKVFMSDMDEIFYNSWRSVMGNSGIRLFSTWNVLKVWKDNLVQKIKITEKQEIVHKLLQALIYELDIFNFEKLLQEVLESFNSDSELIDFGNYFFEQYVKQDKFKSWAYCFRVHLGVNPNIYIDNFNKALNCFYLSSNKDRRLGETVSTFMQFINDKLFNLMIKIQREKLIQKQKYLIKNHKGSLQIHNVDVIKKVGKWQVISSTTTDVYTVKRVTVCNTCQLRCLKCNTCFHEHMCTCMGSSITNNMCIHAHAVARSEAACHAKKRYDNTTDDRKDSKLGAVVIGCEQRTEIFEESLIKKIGCAIEENYSENKRLEAAELFERVTSLSVGHPDICKYVYQQAENILSTVKGMLESFTNKQGLIIFSHLNSRSP